MATKTWQNGGVNNNYSTAGNWVEGSKPATGDDVVIAAAYNMTVDEATAVVRSWDMTGYANTMSGSVNITVSSLGNGAQNCIIRGASGYTGTLDIRARDAGDSIVVDIGSYGGSVSSGTSGSASGSYIVSTNTTLASTRTWIHNYGTLKTDGATDNAGLSHSWGLFNTSNSNTRTCTFGTSNITITGTGSAFNITTATNLTFSGASSTITLTGASPTFIVGAQTFGTVIFSGSGTPVFNSNATVTTLTRTGTAVKTDGFNFASGNTPVITTLNLNGNSTTNRLLVGSSTLGTARNMTVTTVSASNADFRDIAMSGSKDLSAITGLSGDCGGNSGITFTTPATQTATMSTSKSWSDATIWTSRVPLPQDSIDASGWTAGTLTLDMPRLGKNIDFSAATNGVAIAAVTIGLTSYGDVNLTKIGSLGSFGAGGTGSWTMESMARTGTIYLTTNGREFSGTGNRSAPLIIASTGATTEFLDAVATGGNTGSQDAWSISGGGVTFGSFTYTITRYTISSTTLTLNGATLNTNIAFTFSGTTVVPGTSTISFATSTVAQSFSGGGKTYNNFNVVNGTGALTVGGSNTFSGTVTINSPKTVTFSSGTTQTVSNFVATGTAGNLITLNAPTLTTTPPIITKSGGGTVQCDYLNIQGVNVTPASTWYYGNNSTDGLGLNFAGQSTTGDYVSAANSATANRMFGATSFSVETWFVARSIGGGTAGRLVDKSSGATLTNGYNFNFRTGNVLNFVACEGTTPKNSITSTTASLNTLNHAVAVWTSGSASKIYINGSEAAYSTSDVLTTPDDESSRTFYIGNESGRTRTFDGQIFLTRLYRNVALSAANVTTLYNSGVMTKTSNPLGNATAEYLMKEGTGSTIADGINGVTGTITGADWSNTGWNSGLAPSGGNTLGSRVSIGMMIRI
jgi:autotransporter-associated beta strand protein